MPKLFHFFVWDPYWASSQPWRKRRREKDGNEREPGEWGGKGMRWGGVGSGGGIGEGESGLNNWRIRERGSKKKGIEARSGNGQKEGKRKASSAFS